MDAEQVANPPPAYGEPLTADQFDAKTQEGLQVSAQAPQPQPVAEAWEVWNDDTFAAARAQSAYGQSPSSSPSAGASSSRSPPITHTPHYMSGNNSPIPSPNAHNVSQSSTPTRPSHLRRERPPLPQIPSAQLARYQSTKQSQFQRDRKPMGARPTRGLNNQLQQISEGMALKEAERFLTAAPAWQPATSSDFGATGNGGPPIAPSLHQPEPIAQAGVPLQSQNIPAQPQYQSQSANVNMPAAAPQPTHIITQPPASHVPPSLPAIIEAPTPISDDSRHAALFGDNSAFSFRREDGTEDDAPPPFAPVAPTLEDVELQEAMAELQRLQLARANPNVTPVQSSYPAPAPQEVQISGPEQSGNDHLDASSAPARQEQFSHQQQLSASSPSPIPTHADASSSGSSAPAHYRHSAPPSTFRAPSPGSSPSPSPCPAQGMTRAQSAKAQPRYQPLLPPIRFNSSMAYDTGDGSSNGGTGLEATGAKSASDFYSASVSSTMMKVGERRPPARHRMSTASSLNSSYSSNSLASPVSYNSNSYSPRTSFSSSDGPPPSLSSYASSTYARSQRTSFSSADPAPAIPSMYSSGYAESSRSRTPPGQGPGSGGAPTVRSSSPFSLRNGQEPGPGSGGSGDGPADTGGYDIQKQALALQQMQAALDNASPQQPQRVGGSMGMGMGPGVGGSGVQRPVVPPPQGGYFPHIPPPPPVAPMQQHQQQYQQRAQQYAPAQNVPQPQLWANAPLQPSVYPQQSPPHQQPGGYMYPQQPQQQQQHYAPRPIPAPQLLQQQQQQSMQQPPMRPVQMPYAQHAPQQRYSTMY